MWPLTIPILLLCEVLVSVLGTCPEKYTRFTSEHTFCKSNPTCNVVHRGVSDAEKELILKIHNQYRSKVAMGQETEAGHLPSASRMMELIWDDELAAIAQKLADTCTYGHDCNECRMTETYEYAGQNIGKWWQDGEPPAVDWNFFITNLYDEVKDFDKSYVSPYVPGWQTGRLYGHFTQIAWESTWNVGCGVTQYKEGGEGTVYYVCNYGPGGNKEDGASVYKIGQPCSDCPANTCCGSSCAQHGITANYDGLCKVINERLPPEGREPEEGSVFHCTFMNQADCKFTVSGASWKILRTRGGNYVQFKVSGGQSVDLTFKKAIRSTSGRVCFNMAVRRMPARDTDQYDSNTSGLLKSDSGDEVNVSYWIPYGKITWIKFMENPETLQLQANTDYKLSFSFDVPQGAAEQILEIRKITAKEGSC